MPDLDRRYLWGILLFIVCLVFLGGMKYADLRSPGRNQPEILSDQPEGVQASEKEKEAEIIQVYVIGAVEKPGVYRLPQEARAYEAVEMAKPLPVADLNHINLASKLGDGQALVVPQQGEEGALPDLTSAGETTLLEAGGGKVNINSASAEELDQKLPGVGPTIAQRIVDYRISHGDFSQVEDLKEVSGIGDKKFADLQDLVTVR